MLLDENGISYVTDSLYHFVANTIHLQKDIFIIAKISF